MAYDLIQAVAVQVLLRGNGAAGDIAAARLLASRLKAEDDHADPYVECSHSYVEGL